MKNVLTVLFLATTIVFGGLYFREKQQTVGLQARVETAEKAAKSTADATVRSEKKIKELTTRLARVETDAVNSAARAANAEQSLASTQKNAAAPPAAAVSAKTSTKGGALGEMFKDPAMRDMIRAQQKAFMGQAVDMAYGSLFKDLNLPPDQTDKLKDLLKGKMLAATEMGMDMLSGDMTPEKRKELTDKMKEQGDAVNAQIRQLLGDQGYQQFETYEKMQPERQTVTGLKQQLPSSAALSGGQEQQLLQAMYDERKTFKFSTDFYDQKNVQANPADYLTDERLSAFAKEKEQLDQLTLIKARQILTADQLVPFEQFQKTQRDMQVNAMKMAAKMFSSQGK